MFSRSTFGFVLAWSGEKTLEPAYWKQRQTGNDWEQQQVIYIGQG